MNEKDHWCIAYRSQTKEVSILQMVLHPILNPSAQNPNQMNLCPYAPSATTPSPTTSMNQSINQPTNQSTSQPVNRSTGQPVNRSIGQSINQ